MMAQRTDPRGEGDKPAQDGSANGNGVEAKPNGEGRGESAAARRGPWRSYKEQVASIAQHIVDAQRPIRVLQALRWEPTVEEAFRRSKYRELPRVGVEEYAKVDLGFEPKAKMEEFEAIAEEVENEFGAKDPIGRILAVSATEYREVVRMLAARGTKEFYQCSKKLYGSPKDKFPDGKTSVRDLGLALYETLSAIAVGDLGPKQPADIDAETAAEILNQRFASYFHETPIQVQVDDSMLADAAAGSDYVKIRSGAKFSQRDVDILEVHEGWVHVATSLNGQAQPVAKWLAKGPPRTTAVQEGLAAMLELFTFRSYPKRARKLNDRILAVDKAEDGANFIDVFEWYRTEGYEEDECYANARRVFRGGMTEGDAPFTKDACYCKGIVLNYAFIRAAIQNKRADLVPYLFVGKVAHEDIPVLQARVADGVVRPPIHVPPMFRDMNGLAIWTAYSNFFFRMGGSVVDDYYAKLFRRADG
ncbi:MAG TPA: flavohemoglobin expression-modulating QEGLA motif protein [Polyangiaceae bacterium]|nr:flavohemoglobin expression-modulating QEGLA motif protein [Polyangiaceae bacterium]